MTDVIDKKIVMGYKNVAMDMLKYNFPSISNQELNEAIDYSIIKRYSEEPVSIHNNYKNREVNMNLLDLTEYIISKEPIITAYGVMFRKHGEVKNPLIKMTQKFMEGRDIYKKEMFKFPKGSEEFEKYNLLQLLAKLDANALYGAIGQYSCMYYNLYIAPSVTSSGRSLISACGLQFEMFLSNNVKFGSLNELVQFIHNIKSEKLNRHYSDTDILDRNISIEECFNKLIITCGFEWQPTEKELDIIWEIVMRLDQEELNRVYYKNNLYEFVNNSSISKAVVNLLLGLEKPFLNPNKPPKEIQVELEVFCDLLKEYVYYSHQIIDRIDRMANMIKNTTVVSDTDSCFCALDAWYRCVLEKVQGLDMNILHEEIDAVKFLESDEFGDVDDGDLKKAITFIEPELDYDFYTDETIEMERCINPITIIPQDGLRYSIINIMSYCLTEIINDYMVQYTKNSNSHEEGRKCLIYMKNEFQFKRVLLTDGMKNYASIQELQEGHVVGNKLDVKGLPMTKSTVNAKTREELQKILYEDVLNIPKIDQVRVLKKLAIMEKGIYNSLVTGDKSYYKPATIKSLSNYEDPMRIQGIKAALVWNKLRDENEEAIDLEVRNAIDIVKVNITPLTVEKIRDIYPQKYTILKELMNTKDFSTITSIAIPINVNTPEWLKEFIDYTTIINDNMKNFPLDSIGLTRGGKDSVNYSNILSI